MSEALFKAELQRIVIRVVAGVHNSHVAEVLVWPTLLNVCQRRVPGRVNRRIERPVGTGPVPVEMRSLVPEIADACEPVTDEFPFDHQIPLQQLRNVVTGGERSSEVT